MVRALLIRRLLAVHWSRTMILVLAFGSIVALSPHTIPLAHAAGILYVLPSSVPLQPGSSFSVKIQVAGIDPFDGWDIQVQSDPSVINATSLSISGNLLAANYSLLVFTVTSCINGVGCHSPGDGMGVVHSAAAVLGGSNLPKGPSDGLLFTITYQVVGSGTYSQIHILNELITNAPNPNVSVETQDGSYGIPPGQGFSLTVSPKSTSFIIGSNANITINVSSFGNYSGTVDLSLSVSPAGLLLSLNSTSVTLSPNQSSFAELTAATDSSYQQATQYAITVTGTSSGFPQSTTLSITTLPKPDFILNPSPDVLKIHAGNSGSSTITLDTQTGFSGSIHLTLDVPPVPGLVASLGDSFLTISPGQPATTVFSVRTPQSDLPFEYKINITASSQSHTHTSLIRVQSPSPNFDFQVGASSFTVQAGQSRTFTFSASSLDYFNGTLYFLASSLSGIKEVFSRSSVRLDPGKPSPTTLMTITTDSHLSPGNHYVNVTALGTTFLGPNGPQANHSLIVTVTITAIPVARTILGLQPVAYFGLVGVLWLGLIGIALREIRKPKRTRFLS